jgi:hypothetical protein
VRSLPPAALALAALSCAIAPHAQAPAVPAAPAAPVVLRVEALAYFVGTWSATARDPGSGRTFTMRYRMQPSLDGAWLEAEGDASGIDLRVRDLWGRDPVSGDLVRVVFQSDRTWGVVQSKGWEGEALRFQGTARSGVGEAVVRETITRVGPDEFRAVWEAEIDGEWKAYSVERFVRERVP